MVAIFKYSMGLQFTGLIAKNEEEAWAFLEKYEDGDMNRPRPAGRSINKNAYSIEPVYMIQGDE